VPPENDSGLSRAELNVTLAASRGREEVFQMHIEVKAVSAPTWSPAGLTLRSLAR
jgi:hypothetical protein